jgi:ASC-1-like (ASCH) protein
MIHQLKIKQKYFNDIIDGIKRFEVRNNDREFCVGDILGLNEVDEDGVETGSCTLAEVTYVLHSDMLKDGYVVLGIEPFPKVHYALTTPMISNREETSKVVNGYLVME